MSDFQKVCHVDQLVKDSGVAALINDEQIAVFYIDGQTYATSNYDPLGKAYVMSRGLVGDLKGQLMVASPLNKEHYNLVTGQSLDKDNNNLPVFESKIENDEVFVKL